MIWWGLMNIFKYLLCQFKNKLNIFNFHGKALREKNFICYCCCYISSEVQKFEDCIAKKLQRAPIFELLLVLSAQ